MSLNKSKPRFFTGIQSSGTLTLGHYLGIIHHSLLLQEEYEIIIMIADLHALTIPNQQIDYQQRAREIAALLYSCGLKEENCKIFIQSQIKEHLELTWLLAPLVTVGELNNMIQYKEKKKNEETGNLALLTYPVLMAADIFLYDADLVIVGQDQQQHCELTAAIFRKFNNFYQTKLLKLPQFNIPKLGSKIMDLRNPEKKMSKSENDYISLLDQPEIIKKKIKRAKMDSENKIYYKPEEKPGVSNLLIIYALLKKITPLEAEKEASGLNYDQFKTKLAELICVELQSIQKKFPLYQSKIDNLLEKGQLYCQKLAQQKLRKIKEVMKLTT